MNTAFKKIPNTVFVLGAVFLGFVVWWVSLGTRGLVDTSENYWFGVAGGAFAILGGLCGLTKARAWGAWGSYIGKTVIFISLGLITWGIGSLVIGYYNLHFALAYPYPSIADVAYIASWPLWLIGMFNLSRATGVSFRIKRPMVQLGALFIMFVSFAISYYLLFVVAREGIVTINQGNLLRLIFDFAYPLGDVVIVTSSLFLFGLSVNYLGGRFKYPIMLIIAGFLMNYIGDVVFTYTNTVGTFYVSNWVDMLYVTTFFVLGMGINLVDKQTLIGETE